MKNIIHYIAPYMFGGIIMMCAMAAILYLYGTMEKIDNIHNKLGNIENTLSQWELTK